MAGGEFRFGTASIYMAQRDNIQPNRTSQMRVTTWTRFRRPQRHFLSTSAAFIVSARGKLGLGQSQERPNGEVRSSQRGRYLDVDGDRRRHDYRGFGAASHEPRAT